MLLYSSSQKSPLLYILEVLFLLDTYYCIVSLRICKEILKNYITFSFTSFKNGKKMFEILPEAQYNRQALETYRSGHNELDSKSSCRATGTWVRIPSSPLTKEAVTFCNSPFSFTNLFHGFHRLSTDSLFFRSVFNRQWQLYTLF